MQAIAPSPERMPTLPGGLSRRRHHARSGPGGERSVYPLRVVPDGLPDGGFPGRGAFRRASSGPHSAASRSGAANGRRATARRALPRSAAGTTRCVCRALPGIRGRKLPVRCGPARGESSHAGPRRLPALPSGTRRAALRQRDDGVPCTGHGRRNGKFASEVGAATEGRCRSACQEELLRSGCWSSSAGGLRVARARNGGSHAAQGGAGHDAGAGASSGIDARRFLVRVFGLAPRSAASMGQPTHRPAQLQHVRHLCELVPDGGAHLPHRERAAVTPLRCRVVHQLRIVRARLPATDHRLQSRIRCAGSRLGRTAANHRHSPPLLRGVRRDAA